VSRDAAFGDSISWLTAASYTAPWSSTVDTTLE
jgi:hypothetical protein